MVHEKRRVSAFSSTKRSTISQARSGVAMKQPFASRSARVAEGEKDGCPAAAAHCA